MSRRDDLLTDERIWDAYNTLLLGPDTTRIRKLLARYELFKRAMHVPGDVVECGVFKGAGLLYWLKLLEIHDAGGMRRVIGFDTFTGFSDLAFDPEREIKDGYAELEFDGFTGVSPDEITRIAESAGLAQRMELVAGDIATTARQWAEANPGSRICLLHLDLDTYAGTQAALEALYPRVVRGGLIVLDEYAFAQFGESAAVDEFLGLHPGLAITAVERAHSPTAYIVKTA
jgi:hypothetical protein